MRDHLIYISVLITLFCYSPAWADTFVVNSALPTGAGSLRDAIEKANANGTAVTDYITFDLPTRRGTPTILLSPNTPLPALTSNIVIDGSSQPGDALGITDAKVAVAMQGFFTDNSRYYFIFQATNATNIQIYGLFLWAQIGDRSTGSPPQHLYGINLRQCSEVIIGAPGKGNLISGWSRAVYAEYFRGAPCHHITVQSNIMGLIPMVFPPSSQPAHAPAIPVSQLPMITASISTGYRPLCRWRGPRTRQPFQRPQ